MSPPRSYRRRRQDVSRAPTIGFSPRSSCEFPSASQKNTITAVFLLATAIIRAFPVPYPRAYLGTAQAYVTLDAVAVNGLGHPRQLAPVVARPNAGYALLFTFGSRCLVVRHSIQIRIRAAPPPRLPRQGSEKLILPLLLQGTNNLSIICWKTKTNEFPSMLQSRF